MWALFEGSIQNVLLQKNLARLLGTSSFNPSKVCIPIHVSRFIFPRFLFWVKLWIGEILHHLALQKTNSLDPEARKTRDFFFEKEMNLNQSFMALGSKSQSSLQGLSISDWDLVYPLPYKINHSCSYTLED